MVVEFLKGGKIIISTKDKIKKEALALIAQKGYFGTSMSEIAEAVGINKASLYSHYSGKDHLFLAVAEDVLHDMGVLFECLSQESKKIAIDKQLYRHFTGYILYLYQKRDIQRFLNLGMFHVPKELQDKMRSNYLNWEIPYRRKLEDIFAAGIEQGLIRNGDPSKKVWSFKIKRDGVAAWLISSPDLNEDCLEEFWEDFWLGQKKK